jgi:hypothetical protein
LFHSGAHLAPAGWGAACLGGSGAFSTYT